MLRDTISWVRHDQEILYILYLALFLSAEQLCKITAGLRIHVFFYTDQTFCFDGFGSYILKKLTFWLILYIKLLIF